MYDDLGTRVPMEWLHVPRYMGDIPGMPNQLSGSASFSGRSISAYRTLSTSGFGYSAHSDPNLIIHKGGQARARASTTIVQN
jgi:hypothetical protein